MNRPLWHPKPAFDDFADISCPPLKRASWLTYVTFDSFLTLFSGPISPIYFFLRCFYQAHKPEPKKVTKSYEKLQTTYEKLRKVTKSYERVTKDLRKVVKVTKSYERVTKKLRNSYKKLWKLETSYERVTHKSLITQNNCFISLVISRVCPWIT